jgi:hypothetical protein
LTSVKESIMMRKTLAKWMIKQFQKSFENWSLYSRRQATRINLILTIFHIFWWKLGYFWTRSVLFNFMYQFNLTKAMKFIKTLKICSILKFKIAKNSIISKWKKWPYKEHSFVNLTWKLVNIFTASIRRDLVYRLLIFLFLLILWG